MTDLTAELRDALEDALAVLTADTVGTIYHDDPDWYAALDKAVAKGRAALAKLHAVPIEGRSDIEQVRFHQDEIRRLSQKMALDLIGPGNERAHTVGFCDALDALEHAEQSSTGLDEVGAMELLRQHGQVFYTRSGDVVRVDAALGAIMIASRGGVS